MADLRVSADLSLPREAVTETFAILAKRGVGKTYTASVLVEAPAGLSRAEVAERSGYSPTSSHFSNSLSALRTLGLISGSGQLRASETFFQ